MSAHIPLGWEYYGGITLPNLFSALFGADIGSKILFIFILLSAYALGIVMVRTLAHLFRLRSAWYIEAFAGSFFLVQPFAYERLITQPIVYLGIVLLGFLLVGLIRFRETHKPRDILLAGFCGALALYVLPHSLYMIVLIYSVYLITGI